MTCVVAGCEKPVRYPRRGLCNAHYVQEWRHETGTTVPPTPTCRCGAGMRVLWTRAIGRTVIRMRRCVKCQALQPTRETFMTPKSLEKIGGNLLMQSYDKTQQPKGSAGTNTVGGTAS